MKKLLTLFHNIYFNTFEDKILHEYFRTYKPSYSYIRLYEKFKTFPKDGNYLLKTTIEYKKNMEYNSIALPKIYHSDINYEILYNSMVYYLETGIINNLIVIDFLITKFSLEMIMKYNLYNLDKICDLALTDSRGCYILKEANIVGSMIKIFENDLLNLVKNNQQLHEDSKSLISKRLKLLYIHYHGVVTFQ